MTEQVRRQRLSEQVTSQLVEEIVGGRWQPWEMLPTERELAQRFGVSIPVVREGMRALSARGFVQVRHGAGAFVTAPEKWNSHETLSLLMRREQGTLLSVHEVRTYLELETAPLAAIRATGEQIAAVGRALDDMILHCDDPAKHCAADLDFHLQLARATGNPMFAVVLQPIAALIQEGILRGGGSEAYRVRGIQQHQAIYESLRRHDPAAAREAMAVHMRTSRGELAEVEEQQTEAS
jgi:GntR family transcriptional repressor for pyruvate dehydrogenase complex